MLEEFKLVKDYPNYKISNKGRIFTNRANSLVWKEKKLGSSMDYVRTQLINSEGRKTFSVHILVVEHFIGEIKEGLEVNNIDGDTYNNIVSNLEIVTPKENCEHRDKLGKGNLNKVLIRK